MGRTTNAKGRVKRAGRNSGAAIASGHVGLNGSRTQLVISLPAHAAAGNGSVACQDGVAVSDAIPILPPAYPGFTGLLIRGFEIAVAAAALLLTAPLIAVIALLVRLDSPGPALFRQKRLGLGGRPFQFYKFRTLYADARQSFPELYAYRYSEKELDRLQFKVEDDPRVTRVGRWLRRSTLDELPNFLNILTGDMALVGPRPEIPEMLKYYRGEDRLKFSVRPGITGLAQISGRGRLLFRETLQFDLAYVRSRSFLGDVKILLRTLALIVKSDGAF